MVSLKKLYRIYYIILFVLGVMFSFAVYENYSEKEELKGIILNSYADIIKNTIDTFVKLETKENYINQKYLKEFMQNLEIEYNDFKVQFLFRDEKLSKEELNILKYLEKNNFYKSSGIVNKIYYVALKNPEIKNKYNNLFISHSGDIIGIIRFLEEGKKDNIAGDLEENFYVTEGLFISIWFISALLGFIFLQILKKYFKIIEEKNQLEIEKEVAKKNEQLKSEFLANMSHEIRTPLNAMFGFINLLEEKQIDKEGKKYLQIIKKSGETLLNIINDILDFSKIEAGKMSIEKVPFNLKDEVRTIYTLFENKAHEKNIKLNITEKNIDVNIESDPTRIKQVISNILSNAIKFTPEGKNIDLVIEYDDKKEELYVEVKDEGIGIPREKLLTIFESFSQADNSVTRKYGGTGLGLSISYNLVKLLGGSLRVESEEQKGSKFYFRIKAKKTDKPLENKVVESKNEIFDYNVLLVEDNKANQMFMSVILKKLGLKFDIANDGIEAVEMYKKNYNKYDLILMDENMPNMTGSEATQEIREFERENFLKEITIVAITANALSGDKDKFLTIGFNYYLSKPLEVEKLKEILREIK